MRVRSTRGGYDVRQQRLPVLEKDRTTHVDLAGTIPECMPVTPLPEYFPDACALHIGDVGGHATGRHDRAHDPFDARSRQFCDEFFVELLRAEDPKDAESLPGGQHVVDDQPQAIAQRARRRVIGKLDLPLRVLVADSQEELRIDNQQFTRRHAPMSP